MGGEHFLRQTLLVSCPELISPFSLINRLHVLCTSLGMTITSPDSLAAGGSLVIPLMTFN
jgi:hypothetical protein